MLRNVIWTTRFIRKATAMIERLTVKFKKKMLTEMLKGLPPSLKLATTTLSHFQRTFFSVFVNAG